MRETKTNRASGTLTILRTAGRGAHRPVLAKRWQGDGQVADYDRAKHFHVTNHPVDGIKGLYRALRKLSGDRHACVIRGRVTDEAASRQVDDGQLLTRTLDNFDDVPRRWLMFDVDDWGLQDGETERQAAQRWVREVLPEGFHGASFVLQLSSTHGHIENYGLLKAHVWFWLDAPVSGAQLGAWGKARAQAAEAAGGVLGFDLAVFRTVQILYTAAPAMDKGVRDPVPARVLPVKGQVDEATLELTEDERAAVAPAQTGPQDGPDVRERGAELLALLRDALRFINPQGRDEWISTCAQLRHGVLTGALSDDDGYDLWSEWSTGALWHEGPVVTTWDEQDDDANRSRWDGMAAQHTGLRALLAAAGADGWANPDNVASADEFDDLSAERSAEQEQAARQQAAEDEALHVLGGLIEQAGDRGDWRALEQGSVLSRIINNHVLSPTSKRTLLGQAHDVLKAMSRGVGRKDGWVKRAMAKAATTGRGSGPMPDELQEMDLERWVRVVSGHNRFVNLDSGRSMTRQDFVDMLDVAMMHAGAKDDGGGSSLLWAQRWHSFDVADGLVAAAGWPEVFDSAGKRFINTYRDRAPDEVPQRAWTAEQRELVAAWREQIEWMLSDVSKGILLPWLHQVLLNPGQKLQWTIYLTGEQGVGKNILCERFAGLVMGEGGVTVARPTDVASRFNGWAVDSPLINVDEVQNAESGFDFADQLKRYITGDTIRLEDKGVDSVTVPNTSNYVMTGNDLFAVPVSEGDRRMCFLRVKRTEAEGRERDPQMTALCMATFGDWGVQAVDSAAGVLRAWVRTWPQVWADMWPDKLPTRAPMTPAKQSAISGTAGEELLEFAELVDWAAREIPGCTDKILSFTNLSSWAEQVGVAFPVTKQVKYVMGRLGFDPAGRKRTPTHLLGKGNPGRHQVYVRSVAGDDLSDEDWAAWRVSLGRKWPEPDPADLGFD